MFVPFTEIAPLACTEAKSTCPAFVTVRLASFVVLPTAPESVTVPVSASRVSVCAPCTVEVNVMSPSVPVPSLSLSTLTLAARSTGPVNVTLPPSVS